MAKIKNLEMAQNLSNNLNINIIKGFLSFGSKAIYTPTNSVLRAIINYYNAEEGEKLVKLLKLSDEQFAKEVKSMKRPHQQVMSNYRLEICITDDKQFVAIQMFGYADFKHSALTELRYFEGETAEAITKLL